MIIVVETKLKIYNPELERWIFGETETWKFNHVNGKLYACFNNWATEAQDLETAFQKIQGYFSGSNYVITDLSPGAP